MQEKLSDALVASGLTRMSSRVLACLCTTNSGGLTAADLVQRLHVSPASVSKAVNELETMNLVGRERDYRRRYRYIVDKCAATVGGVHSRQHLEAVVRRRQHGRGSPGGRGRGRSCADEFRAVGSSYVMTTDHSGGVPMTSIQPIVSTPDLPRLRSFYETVLGATQTMRVPDKGPEFYIELRIGETALGIVQNDDTEIGAPVRIILSADVPDVDALLPTVESAGGTAPGRPNDMPWGQRVAHVFDPDGNKINLTTRLEVQT